MAGIEYRSRTPSFSQHQWGCWWVKVEEWQILKTQHVGWSACSTFENSHRLRTSASSQPLRAHSKTKVSLLSPSAGADKSLYLLLLMIRNRLKVRSLCQLWWPQSATSSTHSIHYTYNSTVTQICGRLLLLSICQYDVHVIKSSL